MTIDAHPPVGTPASAARIAGGVAGGRPATKTSAPGDELMRRVVAWLMGITRNTSIDLLRRIQTRPQAADQPGGPDAVPFEETLVDPDNDVPARQPPTSAPSWCAGR